MTSAAARLVTSAVCRNTRLRKNAALASADRSPALRRTVRVPLYFHYAQNLYYDDPKLRKNHDRSCSIRRRAAARSAAQPVTILFDGIEMPGYLRLPRGINACDPSRTG
jgi:hypothetical protein